MDCGGGEVKLINPTDRDLNAAFAEKVAGWRRDGPQRGEKKTVVCRLCDTEYDALRPQRGQIMVVWANGGIGGTFPAWATSFDAVLPWIEKQPYPAIGRIANGDWKVKLYLNVDSGGDEREVIGISALLPRACVIALLRAHGVEIEFTT